MLTEQERLVVTKLAEAWNEYAKLPLEHFSDNDEFRDSIHRAQLQILARPGRREYNNA